MSKDVQDNIFSAEQWLRILLMIGFAVLSWVLRFLQVVVMLIQMLFAVVTGRDNLNVRRVGTILSLYQAHIWLYLSYSTDTRPFPFNDLPESAADLVIDDSIDPIIASNPAVTTQISVQQLERQAADKTDGRDDMRTAVTNSHHEADDIFSDISFTEQVAEAEEQVAKTEKAESSDILPSSAAAGDRSAKGNVEDSPVPADSASGDAGAGSNANDTEEKKV